MRKRIGKSLTALTVTIALLLPGCQAYESQFHKQFRETFQEYKERRIEIDQKRKNEIKTDRYKTFPRPSETTQKNERTYSNVN